MITTRRVTSWLASPRLAVVLLLVLGVWSFLGTLVPQGAPGSAKVATWAAGHQGTERVVAFIGLHRAFSAPIFVAMVLLLAASTIVCSWRRTKVASRRHQLLRDMSDAEASQLAARPTFSVEVPADGPSDPLPAVADALSGMKLHVQKRDGVVVAGSRPWVVYASPVFHWALAALMLVMFGVQLTRASGLMGVPVRASKPLTADSYGLLHEGALRRFKQPPYRIRVDRLDLVYMVDGIDRGPAPTVSILLPDGSVAKSQVVYPNNPMRRGSLMIHPGEIGLAPRFAVISKSGIEGARANVIVDYDDASPTGTTAAEFTITLADPADPPILASVTVPVREQPTAPAEARTSALRATVVLSNQSTGSTVASRTLGVGDAVTLPDGSALRLLGVGYYARLSVVDDPSIPLVYALLFIALAALGVSVLGRQSLAVAIVREPEPGIRVVDVWFRDWRANRVRTEQAKSAVHGALTAPPAMGGVVE